MDRIEKVILRNLVYNEEYLRKVLPFIEPDYFNDRNERVVFEHITKYAAEYNSLITKEVLQIPNKTLNIALAGTGVGKSLFMCHHASSVLLEGKNVLYITLEMAEEKIAERIDANLLNVNIQEIVDLPKPIFEGKVTNLAKKTQGSLIIKEYPTASAHSGHFKALLNRLSKHMCIFTLQGWIKC
jgi:replicative DNA helicase